MIVIDGAQKSGSGTIVRYAVALAALFGKSLHLVNARAKRPKPGLRPQHEGAVLACAQLCGATTSGVHVGSQEFTFTPGSSIYGGSYVWDIGTAGSATMLALSVLPLACFAEQPVLARITGGVFQDLAPSPHHMQYVLAPLLRRMGLTMDLRVIRAGYLPAGAGILELRVQPVRRSLHALQLTEQGSIRRTSGIAFSSHLAERQVSERMARVCVQRLAEAGLTAHIDQMNDSEALHAGASLAVWAESSTGCIFGADRAGALRRSSEAIGRFVASALLEDLASGATVDRHVADQLVLFAALAAGLSHYLTPRVSEHLESNLWLAEQFGSHVRLQGKDVFVDGVGFQR